MSGSERNFKNFLYDLTLSVIPVALFGYFSTYLLSQLNNLQDTNSSKVDENVKKAYLHYQQSGKNPDQFPEFDTFERHIIADMIFPDEISTTLADIGGLTEIKDSLLETVILPLRNPDLYSYLAHSHNESDSQLDNKSIYSNLDGLGHNLVSAPLGVLFYGPPGTGKTLTARALAKESGVVFIPVNLASVESKYVGESQKLLRAVFSVARKLAPAIIFIDEIDAVIGNRSSDYTMTHDKKVISELLSNWDGMTCNNNRIVVIGATNRSFDLDEAILRRMPRQICFDLPDEQERYQICRVLMAAIAISEEFEYDDLKGREAALKYISHNSQDYSGSDLKEVLKYAALNPIKEYVRLCRIKGDETDVENTELPDKPRKLLLSDIEEGLQHVKPTGHQAHEAMTRQKNKSFGTSDKTGKKKGKKVSKKEFEEALLLINRAQTYGIE